MVAENIHTPTMDVNFAVKLAFIPSLLIIMFALMSRTIERTLFMWEKGRGDKCCPGPESCLPRARPVLGASVSEWHIRS